MWEEAPSALIQVVGHVATLGVCGSRLERGDYDVVVKDNEEVGGGRTRLLK